MSCSRALRVEPVGVLVGNRHGELVGAARDGRKDRRRVRELRKHDEPDRQERRRAGDRRVDHREHAIGVRRICRRSSGLAKSVWHAAAE